MFQQPTQRLQKTAFFAGLRILQRSILLALPVAFFFASISAEAHMEGFHHETLHFQQSPEWTEPFQPGSTKDLNTAPVKSLSGQVVSSANQPAGALSGRIVFMNAGHGWTYDPDFSPPWRVLRPTGLNEMNEDYGNIDQLNFFGAYCFNAGAIVVPLRPIGHQTNEVVLDNVSPNVSWVGTWFDSTSTIYYGAAGATPYRYASFAATETAKATYTPNIPKTGFYPVYTWVRHSDDRGHQLYRIRHTGGESQIRIPHHMVGNGWVYLGEYYFNSGSNSLNGAVVVSNLRGTTNGVYTFADAIRFGNGMGSVNRGGGVSDYPREEESARYWIQTSLGQGQLSSIYDGSGDDESDGWGAVPKMAKEMNRETSGNIFKRIMIVFHSNAGGTTARGTTALCNNDTTIRTPNQLRLAQIVADVVDNDLIKLGSPPLELAWGSRGTVYSSANYSEISDGYIDGEFDATLLEVAFHDNVSDAKLLRDSKARAAVARSTVHSIINFFNEKDGLATNYFPESPTNVRAVGGTNGRITLTWTAPITGAAAGYSQVPTNYVIYRSTNGFGFGNPVSIGNVTTCTITNLAANLDYYFQVVAANAGGESMPSEVVGCRAAATNAPKVLFVNAFDRFDRTTNLRQDTDRQNWKPPGPTGINERVWPRSVNAFNYVVPHGKAIGAYGMSFDTSQNEAVSAGSIVLTNYPIVIWAAGQESTTEETFSSAEQTKITTFRSGGGHLFVSGSEIGWDLDRASGPTAADRAFLNGQLHAELGSDTNNDSGIYTAVAVTGSIFAGVSSSTFDNGTKGIYWVQNPDILTPTGTGTKAALYYNGTTNPAAIQYDGSAGGGRVVYFGFPFETITSEPRQTSYMADILDFFTPATILDQPLAQTVNQGSNAVFSVNASGHLPLSYQWRLTGTNLSGATLPTLTLTNVQSSQAGIYSLVVTNSTGIAISSNVTLVVNTPPVISTPPAAQSVVVSNDVVFDVIASGSAPLNYQWAFNGTNISGATNSSLTLENVQLADAGQYSVTVSNFVGSASATAALTVINLLQFSQTTISSNQIQIALNGQPGTTYSIQGSTNLHDWSEITNCILTNGVFEFFDTLTNVQRFYRVVKE